MDKIKVSLDEEGFRDKPKDEIGGLLYSPVKRGLAHLQCPHGLNRRDLTPVPLADYTIYQHEEVCSCCGTWRVYVLPCDLQRWQAK